MSEECDHGPSLGIREIFRDVIGKKIIDITQSDPDEDDIFIEILLEDGRAVRFHVDEFDEDPPTIGFGIKGVSGEWEQPA